LYFSKKVDCARFRVYCCLWLESAVRKHRGEKSD
jgi:hypothetical protein